MPYRLLPGILLTLCLFLSGHLLFVFSQPVEVPLHDRALPLTQRWKPTDYQASNQNWSFTQDANGLLYVGNTQGLLIFDGQTWQRLNPANDSIVRSVATATDGTVYYGAQGEIGYVSADSVGRPYLVSLNDHVPAEARAFSDVWRVVAHDGAMFFQTRQHLFRWDGAALHTWSPAESFHLMFHVDGRLVVRDTGRGLLALVGDSLRLLPGGEQFRAQGLYAVLPYAEGQWLTASTPDGLFLYTEATGTRTPFATEANDFAQTHWVYNGYALSDGRYALGSIGGGLLVFDQQGQVQHQLTTREGLQDDIVLSLYQDDQDGLWAAHENGISRLEVRGPFSYMDATTSAVPNSLNDLHHAQGTLFTATDNGIQRLPPNAIQPAGKPPRFEAIPGLQDQAWKLLPFGTQVLAATSEGVFSYDGTQARRTYPGYVYTLGQARNDTNRVFIGMDDGVASVRWDGTRWQAEPRIEGLDLEARHFFAEADGSLWVGTNYEGLWRVTFRGGDRMQPQAQSLGEADGLRGGDVKVFTVAGRPVFAAQGGFHRYMLGASPAFQLDPAFADLHAAGIRGASWMREDAQGNAWVVRGGRVGYGQPQADGTYHWVETPFGRLANDYIINIQPAQGGGMWLMAAERLLHFDSERVATTPAPFATHIRHVATRADTLYRGHAAPADVPPAPVLLYAHNALTLHYSAPRYDRPEGLRYQVWLEGFDDDWTPWTPETQAVYTNLREGDYTFRVRARALDGTVGTEGLYRFTVLPPWYRTWWAYLSYLMLLSLAVYGLVRVRTRAVAEQAQRLERLVALRTAELEQEKQETQQALHTVAEQAEQLQELDAAKSRLFANVSHEFRTPLTLTIGPLEDIEQAFGSELRPSVQRKVSLALRNARRLLRLINQMLDIAKLESGRMTLQPQPGDFVAHVRQLVGAFTEMAESRTIALRFEAAAETLPMMFDSDAMEKVIGNLLSNAFKFTPEGGTVRVRLRTTPDEVILEVRDNGVGIPADQLPHVFERFHQVDGTSTRLQEGTGIGLSLVNELVALHDGTVAVASEVDFGTTFTLHVPLVRPGVPLAATSEPPALRHATAFVAEAYPASDSPDDDLPDDLEADDRTTILVVDDHAEIRAYVREHLSPTHRVLEAADGQAGVERARAELPDLIISDVMMPRLDGFGLCQQLKQDPATDSIPIILLTARAERADTLEGLGTGADDYIVKPFDVNELRLRVDNQIASRQRLRERLRAATASASHAAGRPPATLRSSQPDVDDIDTVFLERLTAVAETHLDDADFGVEAWSREVGLSRSQLHRRLRETLGQSPGQVLRRIRLERAAQLLARNAGTVTEVAYAVGFRSLSHFAKRFQQQFGTLPSAYPPPAAANSESASQAE